MSKKIKQMEMDVLRNTFQGVRDYVVLTSNKLNCHDDGRVRAALRKKSIRIQQVKNSLTRRVFDEIGIQAESYWQGPTLLAWGGASLAELSSDVETLVKKTSQLTVKGAISEGQPITFKAALAMPTRPQALGRVVALVLAPASRLAAQILAPAGQIAGQIKTLAEKKEEAPPSEAPAGEDQPVAAPAAS